MAKITARKSTVFQKVKGKEMILRKVAYFKCDWCGKEDQSEIERQQNPRGNLYAFLPEGWEGSPGSEAFCSALCEAEHGLKQAQDKLKLALGAKQ